VPREASVRAIVADGLDAIIDLNGHTLNSGLPILAHRVAPVQVRPDRA
jgi:predicted O-linked N-acetylglucosamine transferase (SPINDLY family)